MGWHGNAPNCTYPAPSGSKFCRGATMPRKLATLGSPHLVRRQFWWPGMRKDIESYVKCCLMCASMKKWPGKPPGLLQQVPEPSQIWTEIAMDFIMELPESGGNTVVWTVMDHFSKQAHLVSLQFTSWQNCSCNVFTDCTESQKGSYQIEGFNLRPSSGGSSS